MNGSHFGLREFPPELYVYHPMLDAKEVAIWFQSGPGTALTTTNICSPAYVRRPSMPVARPAARLQGFLRVSYPTELIRQD